MPTALMASQGVASSPSYSSSSFSSTSSLSSTTSPTDSVLTSVHHLLSRALSLPCSTAAHAFSQLVQPTMRFQLALDALLPLLDGNVDISDASANRSQIAQRILVSFILFSLYAPHPISINPFRSALLMTFVNEREKAVKNASGANAGGGSVDVVASNEQLVWVLWKILRGDGNDIGPYTPSTLARSPLPPKLAAINLVLDDTEAYDLDLSVGRKSGSGSATAEVNAKEVSWRSTSITPSEDFENAALTRAMTLVLAARDRVLSLSERRILEPHLSAIATSDIITPLDLASIVTLNPDVAYPLFVGLLIASTSSSTPHNFLDILEILPYLGPSLSTFDLMGKLLRDTRIISVPPNMIQTSPEYQQTYDVVRIQLGRLVQSQVLGRFVHECIEQLEREERERSNLEGSGGASDGDDAWGRGVRNLCRFYLSLIKLDIVPTPNLSLNQYGRHSLSSLSSSASSSSTLLPDNSYDLYDMETFSADSIEIAHFALSNSRFEEARALYGVLASGRING